MRSLLVEAVVCSRRELATTAVLGTTVTTTPITLAVPVDPKIVCLANCHRIEDIPLVEIGRPVAIRDSAALYASCVNRSRLVAQKVLEFALQPISSKSAPTLLITEIGRNIVRDLATENSYLNPPLYLGQIFGDRGSCLLLIVLDSDVVFLGEDRRIELTTSLSDPLVDLLRFTEGRPVSRSVTTFVLEPQLKLIFDPQLHQARVGHRLFGVIPYVRCKPRLHVTKLLRG